MKSPVSHPFGDLLRRYRTAFGLTQEELAERAGLSVEAISLLERGERRWPHGYTVGKLADALALPDADQRALETAARRRNPLPTPPDQAVIPSPHDAALPLAGRAPERAALERHLRGEGPPALFLAGEPGIGKSRLLQEAAVLARVQGWTVLEGGCQRRGGQEPFAPVLGAVQRSIRTLHSVDLRAALRGCAWLVRLLPELMGGSIEPLPSWSLAPDQERRLMFEAVTRFLRNVADVTGTLGTLLLLDDLQWAGNDALDLLTTLVHAATEGHVRVVGAYRDTEVRAGDPLGITLADLAQAELVRQRRLGPLGPLDATRVLESLLVWEGKDHITLDPRDQVWERILRRAGGVPFFLVSCVQGHDAEGADDGAQDTVPWTIAQSVQQRVAALPDVGRDMLGLMAVLGRVVRRPILLAAARRSAEEVVVALEAACRARLVEEEGHDAYRFAHDVIREVVEADLSAAWRVLAHRRVAAALEEQPGEPPVEALAYHCVEGELWAKALEYVERAGDHATATYALRDALHFFEQAHVVCTPAGGATLQRVVVLAEKRGSLNVILGRLPEATSAFELMLETARALGDRRLEGRALVHRGVVEYNNHAFATAETLWRMALGLVGEDLDDVHYDAAGNLALQLLNLNRQAEAEPLVRKTRELRRTVQNPAYRHLSEVLSIFTANWAGRYAEAIEAADHWHEWVEDIGQAAPHFFLLWLEGVARGGKGEYQRALTLLEDVAARTEQMGLAWIYVRCLNTLGWLYGDLQDHGRAVELNTSGLRATLDLNLPNREVESNARLNLGDSLLALGRRDEAEEQFRTVEGVVRDPRPQDHSMLWRYAQHLFHSYGELWLAHHDPDRALRYADECLALALASSSQKNIVKAQRLRGQVLHAQGKLTKAAQEIERALEIARQVGNPPQLWKTLVALGEVRQVQERLMEAARAYDEAVRVIDDVAADLVDPGLRATFLASPQVQHIRQQADAAVAARARERTRIRGVPSTRNQATSPDGITRTTPEEAHPLPTDRPAPDDGTVGGPRAGRSARARRQAWVLRHLQMEPAISPRVYALALDVSVDTALLDLRDLLERGLVTAEGSTKDRRYRLRIED